jgi:hypothetical protein
MGSGRDFGTLGEATFILELELEKMDVYSLLIDF